MSTDTPRCNAEPTITAAVNSPHEWVRKLAAWTPPEQFASADTPVTFEFEGVIAAGKVGALVAGGGTGKTILMLTMFVHGAIGRPFLGRHVRRGSYALMSSDDPQEDLEIALALVVAAMDLSASERREVLQRVRVHSLKAWGGEKTFATVQGGAVHPTDLDRSIIQALGSADDLRILALDTLRQFSGGTTNDEQVVKLSINGAEAVARELGCAVVIAHHTGKINYREVITDMYAGSGSAAIGDNCRFVLLLQNASWRDVDKNVARIGPATGTPLVLRPTRGSLLVKAAPPMWIRRDDYLIEEIKGATPSSATMFDTRDREILSAVRDGDSSKSAIYERVKGRKKDVFAAIDALEKRGLIMNSAPNGSAARPKLLVTDAGIRHLELAERADLDGSKGAVPS